MTQMNSDAPTLAEAKAKWNSDVRHVLTTDALKDLRAYKRWVQLPEGNPALLTRSRYSGTEYAFVFRYYNGHPYARVEPI